MAGGSGLSPILSIAAGIARSKKLAGKRVMVFYGGREAKDLCAARQLDRLFPDGHRFEVIEATSEGEEGASIYTNQKTYHTPVVPPERIDDPTGVGDAFRGGFLTGYSLGFPMEVNGRMGALAATYCLEQKGPQGHFFTPQEFVARYRQNFDDQGILDKLVN